MPFKKGILNPKYKHGKTLESNFCLCGKKLKDYRATRCQVCENKRRFSGKTYEEIYGIEIANKLKKSRSDQFKGVKFSREHRFKISKNTIGRISSFKNKKHSFNSKRLLSLSHGGTGIPYENSEYGSEFDNHLKEKIRFIYNYRCTICGCSQLENGRQLSIHHIDYDKQNNKIENLVSLCIKCHIKTNYNRNYWIDYFEKFLGRVEE